MRIAAITATALLMAGCGSSSVSSHSPAPTATASAGAASPTTGPVTPTGVMALLIRNSPQGDSDTLALIDTRGHVDARVEFTPPARAFVANCASIPPPPVRVAANAAYFADSTGAIRRLDATGATTQVARFPISATSFLSFAVSPDGQKLIAIVFNTPTPKNPIPPLGTDPFVATSHWTLDLEVALAGGPTTTTLHRDLGHAYPPNGPTLIAGWDDVGPVATLSSVICVQNVIPSIEFTGGPLIHLGQDGAHLDRIGDPTCAPWDELHDGTVLCGGSNWNSFTVETRTGSALWSRAMTNAIFTEPRLSPDGTGVTANMLQGPNVIFLRDNATPASSARNSSPDQSLLGWVGDRYVLAVASAAPAEYGLLPASDPSNFIKIGELGSVCGGCSPGGVTLVGTIGI